MLQCKRSATHRSMKCSSITDASMSLEQRKRRALQNNKPIRKLDERVVNITRIGLSSLYVALDCTFPCAAEPPLTKLSVSTFHRIQPSAKLSNAQYFRSIILFLDNLKDQESLAIQLYNRDSQKVEKCKSLQRQYISHFRQRQNGKFSAETKPLSSKIRAPISFKQESDTEHS